MYALSEIATFGNTVSKHNQKERNREHGFRILSMSKTDVTNK
jgi:hypothetical protein